MRPKPPTKFDLTPESYHQHNKYFNEAEKCFDAIQRWMEEIDSRLWNYDETLEITMSDMENLEIILGGKES